MKLYTCPECGLSYEDEVWEKKCEAWCKKTNSCNIDIIEHAVSESEKDTLVTAKRKSCCWGVGTLFVGLCCITPLAVVLLTGIGLTYAIPALDYILIPLFIICLSITLFGLRKLL